MIRVTCISRCLNSVQNDFAENKIYCECDQRCNDDYWRLQYSTLAWPAENFEPYLFGSIASTNPDVAAKLVDRQFTMDNIVELNVYYEELNQQVLVESPKVTAWTMLSTIGGSMGLYIGVSVITICEVVQFLAESVHYVKKQ